HEHVVAQRRDVLLREGLAGLLRGLGRHVLSLCSCLVFVVWPGRRRGGAAQVRKSVSTRSTAERMSSAANGLSRKVTPSTRAARRISTAGFADMKIVGMRRRAASRRGGSATPTIHGPVRYA